MKKVIVLLVICFGLSAIVLSCRDTKKEAHSETSHEHDADLAHNDTYSCPMGCEDEKTYKEEGDCPVCNMVLKRIDKDDTEHHAHDLDSEKPHKHDSDSLHETHN